MKNYLLLIFAILLTSIAHASWYPPITNYSNSSSLVSRQNWKISQGTNGWIYFANNRGLLEFNGIGWELRSIDKHSIIRSVKCDDNGRIYVGANGEIGYFAPDEMGRLTYTNLTLKMDQSLRSFDDVWSIHIANNNTYFQYRQGILIMDRYGDFSQIKSEEIIKASCMSNNSIYYVTNSGLYVIAGNESISIKIYEECPFAEISAITPLSEGRILLATSFDGLFIYAEGKITPFRTKQDQILKEDQIYSVVAGDEYIACGTVRGGVVIMDLDGHNTERLDLRSGLDNNTVLSVMFDNHNNLWCGLDNGVNCITLNSPLRHSDTNREFRHSGYTALLDTPYLYLGTNQGLIRLFQESDDSIASSNTKEMVESIANSEGQVWSIQKIGDRIYCCHNRGLFELYEDSNKGAALRPIYTGDGVWDLSEVSPNRMVAGTYDGLLIIERQAEHYSVKRVTGHKGSVRDMVLRRALRMGFYISEQGLERIIFDDEFQSVREMRLIENDRYEIKLLEFEGQLLAYTPQTIYRINDDGSIQPTSQYDNIFDRGTTYAMISVDDNNNIWYEANNSLIMRRYNQSTGEYDEPSKVLLTNSNFFIPGFTRIESLNDRYNIINSIDGFSVVDSEWREIEYKGAEPLIVALYSISNTDSLLLSGAYGVAKDRIKLPYAHNTLQFTYSCNAVDNNAIEYSYRLRGSDAGWSGWSRFDDEMSRNGRNRKEYTQLPEGEYQFQLRVKSDDGDIESRSLDIVISPPWQRSNFMYTIYLLLFITLLWAITYRIRSVNIDRRRLVILQSKRQIEQQRRKFESYAMEQENNIIKLENEKLESEVKTKSAELSNLLLNKLEKNDLITSTKADLEKIRIEAVNHQYDSIIKRVSLLNRHLDDKMVDNIDWSTFEDNFNITNNNFVEKIRERYSWMTASERRLCVYIKLGLQNKEISPLLNLSVRGVEMLRYRVRKKMGLDRNENLYEFFQRLSE